MPVIGKGREGWFLLLFLLQFCLYTGILTYYEHVVNGKDGLSTFVAVLGGMPGIITLSTASTIVFLEGLEMLSERYLKRRYEEGKEEGLKEVEVYRGREAWGRGRGRSRMGGIERRIAAENAGEEFNEPPPSGRNGK